MTPEQTAQELANRLNEPVYIAKDQDEIKFFINWGKFHTDHFTLIATATPQETTPCQR